MRKLKNSGCDKIQNLNCDKTKKKQSNCDKTQKLKLWQNIKFEIATNSTELVKKKKNKNSNCDKTYIMTKLQTHKFKYQQNLKTQIWNKLKNINCDKTKKSNSYYWISKEKNFNCFYQEQLDTSITDEMYFVQHFNTLLFFKPNILCEKMLSHDLFVTMFG